MGASRRGRDAKFARHDRMKILFWLSLVLLLSGSLICASSRVNAQVGDESGNSFKHLVDIGGGGRLNLVCMGKGSPTGRGYCLETSGASWTCWH
jgi:hypothetical protein